MTVYIIRPKTTSVARSLKLASRKFTAESRPSQVAEVVNFWQEDSGYQEITSYLEDSDTITQYPTYSNITGAKVVDVPDEDVEQLHQDLPNALILRDRPIELIKPEKSTAVSKTTLTTDDLWPLVKEFTNQLLRQGKLLLLLDGLDEVPNKNFELVIDKIQDFVQQYKQNKFIISCRTAAYHQKFNNFKEFIIADFNDQQIQKFIKNWFCSQVDKQLGTAQKCWNKINSEKATKELARTPLLSTFLCLEYDESQYLPKNRATLYGNALDILLRRWAAETRLPEEAIYNQMGIDLEKIMLAEIAYHNFAADKLFFSQQEVLNQIQKFLSGNDNAPENLDPGKILDAITIEQRYNSQW